MLIEKLKNRYIKNMYNKVNKFNRTKNTAYILNAWFINPFKDRLDSPINLVLLGAWSLKILQLCDKHAENANQDLSFLRIFLILSEKNDE